MHKKLCWLVFYILLGYQMSPAVAEDECVTVRKEFEAFMQSFPDNPDCSFARDNSRGLPACADQSPQSSFPKSKQAFCILWKKYKFDDLTKILSLAYDHGCTDIAVKIDDLFKQAEEKYGGTLPACP